MMGMSLVGKKYWLLALFFLMSSVASAQIMLPAYQGTYTKPIASASNSLNYDLGNALSFDGTNDYVAFPSSSVIDNLGTGSFTMEAMISGTLSGTKSIIRKTSDYNLFVVN
jgi:hypothetical protein